MTDEPSGHLLHNLLLFGRLLRGLGLEVNPGRMMDWVEALAAIEIGRRSDFYYAARCLLVHRREDVALFDQAFNLFWRKPAEGWSTLDLRDIRQHVRPPHPLIQPPPLRQPNQTDGGDGRPAAPETPILEISQTYSGRELLRRKDFGELSAEELAEVKRLMAHLVWRLGQRRTRRLRPGGGRQVDWRRSLRRNFRYGGELLEWARREAKWKPRPLVIIADVSGSMERYTRLLLSFIYSLAGGLAQPVEAFVFSTRLTHITRQLRTGAADLALRLVAQQVPDWSGGTRIGEALKTFNYDWARRLLGRGAVVLLISDGWDRGEPELLGQEMARLQRSCYRLIWLNPLLGSPEYRPLTRGMQAALPYVDDFLPVHNLVSLEDLADHLLKLDDRRPFGRKT
ncbi:MAG: VWA domain-containing protein [Chloroflexota bacterium]